MTRDDHGWLVPRVRAAVASGLPPTAVILEDPTHKEWDNWDLRLVTAIQIYDGLMVGNVPIHWDRSDRVAFDVKSYISKSRAAVERREAADEKAKRKAVPGKSYYPVPRTIDGGPLPTWDEFEEEQRAKQGTTALG